MGTEVTPTLTKFTPAVLCFLGGIMVGVGDVVTQYLQADKEDRKSFFASTWDVTRTTACATLEAILLMPVRFAWLAFLHEWGLERSLPEWMPSHLADQVLSFSPVCTIFDLTVRTSVLQNPKYENANPFVHFSPYIRNALMWAPLPLINLSLVPVWYQPLFGSAASVLWNAKWSHYLNHKSKEKK